MNEPIKVSDAIYALTPNARYQVFNNDVTQIDWQSEDIEQPSNEAIQAKITELQADYDSKQYRRDRAVAYPSTADQLDMLYHQGVDGWKAKIKSVKDQFPKP